ncbi:MAG: benzoate/H(+) symporter BenE family transporter [Negativicutes bacterium]|nr:benzoate/H(+) symporter BenE family transporter [Negativicutes bacterium]
MENTCFVQNLKDLPKNLNVNTVSAGLLSGIFGITTSLIIIGAGTSANLPEAKIISWIFSTFFFGAVVGLILTIKYRQPLPGAWSIPGAALVAISLKQFPFSDMIGAYFVAGVIVFLLGASGLMGRVIRLFPLPIVLAMIVGVLMSFGIGMITSLKASPLVSGTAIGVYLLTYRYRDKVPPILVAFVISGLVAVITNQFQLSHSSTAVILPQMEMPTFTIGAVISVAIPLALLVICGEMPKAIGVLMSQGYKPPVNSITTACGIGGMITSFFGGTNVNIAGPMAAICASPDSGKDPDSRYASVLINAAIFGIFGLLASIAVPFVTALPKALINTIAGLAMINVLLTSLQNSFSVGKFQTGSFFALIISLSGVNFFGIAAPVWSLIGGITVSMLIERGDFKK